jgi:hypothetical protein
MIKAIDYTNNVNSCSNLQQKVAFRGDDAPVNMEQQPDTFEKQEMSTGKKAAIGIGSLLGLVIAGFGIKKGLDMKAANKAVKEAAEAVGITDVKLFKELKSLFGKVVKHDGEKLEITDIISKVDKLNEKGLIKDGDEYILFPPQMTKDFFAKSHPDMNIPENSVAVMIRRADKKTFACRELILNKGLGDTLLDFPQDKLIVMPIQV